MVAITICSDFGAQKNKLRYAEDTTLMAESEDELESLLKVKEESESLA